MNLYRSALLLLAPAVLVIAACASGSGSALVTGNTRAPVAPEQVKIYLEKPAAFEVIGLVNASSDAGWTEQDSLDYAIEELKKQDHRFHMEGGSWTNDISWVRGYENVLGPMEKISALFNEKVLKRNILTSDPRYRNALFHLFCSQTSCFRYWGQGTWTDYGRELCRRTEAILENDF